MSHSKQPTESAQQYLDRLLGLEDVSDARLTAATEAARLAGNNCVVFIMWLLSGDFISSSG